MNDSRIYRVRKYELDITLVQVKALAEDRL